MEFFTEIVNYLTQWMSKICQLLSILVISVGVFKALLVYIKDAIFGMKAVVAIEESRLELGHAFSLGLGFLIGASILSTSLAPTWSDIGQLASIIAIRTLLNHFLLNEIKQNTSTINEKQKI